MTRAPALLAAALAVACGYPDARDADVVVRDGLEAPTQYAIDWWREATGDLGLRLADRCNTAQRHCIVVRIGDAGGDSVGDTRGRRMWAPTTGGMSWAFINVEPSPSPAYLSRVIAHELGHALDIDHVPDPGELMYWRLDLSDQCIGPQTLWRWHLEYGDGDKLRMACRTAAGDGEALGG